MTALTPAADAGIQPVTEPARIARVLRLFRRPPQINGAPAQVWIKSGPAGGWVAAAVLWAAKPTAVLVLLVRPAARRQGTGAALLAQAEAAARDVGSQTLRLAGALEAADAGWFERRGFRAWSRLREFRMPLAEAEQRPARLWPREQGRVPADAELITLRAALARNLLREIVLPVVRAVGGAPQRLAGRIRQAQRGLPNATVDLDFSLVLLHQGKVAGVLLVHYDRAAKVWMLGAQYTDPAYRRAWATVWMRLEFCRRALADGRTREMGFRARDDQADTLRAAQHGAVQVGERRLLEKPLAAVVSATPAQQPA